MNIPGSKKETCTHGQLKIDILSLFLSFLPYIRNSYDVETPDVS